MNGAHKKSPPNPAGSLFLFRSLGSVAFVWHQSHEASSLDRRSDCVLADRSTASLATAHNLAMTVGQLLEQLNVFVINVSRTWTFTINEQRILTNRLCFQFRFTTSVFSFLKCQGFDSTKAGINFSFNGKCIAAKKGRSSCNLPICGQIQFGLRIMQNRRESAMEKVRIFPTG
jgi:hypothetical protein